MQAEALVKSGKFIDRVLRQGEAHACAFLFGFQSGLFMASQEIRRVNAFINVIFSRGGS